MTPKHRFKTHSPGEALVRYLTAKHEAEAVAWLDLLINEYASPVIEGILSRKFELPSTFAQRLSHVARGVPERQLDAEDLHASTVVKLMANLHRLRSQGNAGEANLIENFSAYVAQATLNQFADYMRQRWPRRHRAVRDVKYVLQTHPNFAIWDGVENSGPFCGYSAWRGRPLTITRNYQRWLNDTDAFPKSALLGDTPASLPKPELLARLFNWVGTPMALDEVVRGLAKLLTPHDMEVIPGPEDEVPTEDWSSSANVSHVAVRQLDTQTFVQAIWAEVTLLPLSQRLAYLLHRQGDEILLFIAHGCCSMRQVAEVLGMSLEEFARLLNQLPLPDEEIAATLGMSRRSVINRRISAVRRLHRRLEHWTETGEDQSRPAQPRRQVAEPGST